MKKENFWNTFKKPNLKFSLDKLSIKDFSFVKSSSDKNNTKIGNKQGNNIFGRLGDEDQII